MKTRFMVRREADKQKKQVLDTFEHMKKKGKIEKKTLKKLGLEFDIPEDQAGEDEGGAAPQIKNGGDETSRLLEANQQELRDNAPADEREVATSSPNK